MRMREVTAVVVLALASTACESGFSEADVEQIKEGIRSEYENRPGVIVVDVQMVKESPTKLTGFVKIRPEGLPNSLGTLGEISKNCYATMGDNMKYVWRCE